MLTEQQTWQWVVGEVYCGKRRTHRPAGGFLNVKNGALEIDVDDGYYSGELSPEDSLSLAREIIRQAGAHETVDVD